MDRLLTFPGQQPLYLDDVDFVQDSVKNALAGICGSLMASSRTGDAILGGFEVSENGQQVSWTDGTVSIDGELLPVSAGTLELAAPGDPIYMEVRSALSGERTFRNGAVRSCHERRYAAPTTEQTPHPLSGFARRTTDAVVRITDPATAQPVTDRDVLYLEREEALGLVDNAWRDEEYQINGRNYVVEKAGKVFFSGEIANGTLRLIVDGTEYPACYHTASEESQAGSRRSALNNAMALAVRNGWARETMEAMDADVHVSSTRARHSAYSQIAFGLRRMIFGNANYKYRKRDSLYVNPSREKGRFLPVFQDRYVHHLIIRPTVSEGQYGKICLTLVNNSPWPIKSDHAMALAIESLGTGARVPASGGMPFTIDGVTTQHTVCAIRLEGSAFDGTLKVESAVSNYNRNFYCNEIIDTVQAL